MRKLSILLLMIWLALSGTITVLATTPSVASSPSLFSIVKTDTSKNNNVQVNGSSMTFTPGTGIDGKMYGFQPGSMYYYEDLCRINNTWGGTIYLWHSLDGEMAELYNDGAFWLSCDSSAGEKWIPAIGESGDYDIGDYEILELETDGSTGPINFTFSIAPGQELKDYSGNITFHARSDYDPGDEPGDNPGDDPGDDPGDEPGDDPGDELYPESPDQGPEPSKDPGQDEELVINPEEPNVSSENEDTPDENLIVLWPETPETPAQPPKTGEFPPIGYYGAGLLLILAGLALRKGKNKKAPAK
jgi:LPXTG-motif cell wall-anchored protein